MSSAATNAFFAAVWDDDVGAAAALLATHPELIRRRWPGRGREGKMRSLGPPPYDQHTCLPAPTGPESAADPRFTVMPLHWSRSDSMVQLLVDSGADVNALGSSGYMELLDWLQTPLWRAAHDGRIASVRLLVGHGANLNFRNPDGCNQALKTAVENGRQETWEYLLAAGAIPDLITAAMLGLVDRVQALLDSNPAIVYWRDEHLRTPLDAALLLDTHRAADYVQTTAHDETAERLLRRGARANLPHAASLGRLDLFDQTLQRDPDALHRTPSSEVVLTGATTFETPLQVARRRGRSAILQRLEELGA